MNWKKILAPKDTEEVRPGLYVRTMYKPIYHKGDMIAREPIGYRRVEPVVWNGEYRWKEQLKTVFSLRTIFTIAIICFVAWSYYHDVGEYKGFFDDVTGDPITYCDRIYSLHSEDNLKSGENEFKGVEGYPLTLSDYSD